MLFYPEKGPRDPERCNDGKQKNGQKRSKEEREGEAGKEHTCADCDKGYTEY
jgi:hypothetical protein